MSIRRLTESELNRVIDNLMGTAQSEIGILERVLGDEFEGIELEDLQGADLDLFDERIGRCNDCEWWYDPGDLDDDGECLDCRIEGSYE